MKFTKVNDNEICCVLTMEEMNRFGVNLEDIIEKNARMRRFFHELLEQAGKVLGLKNDSEIRITSAQISILEDHSISIVFKGIKKELSLDMRRDILNMIREQLIAEGNASAEAVSELDALRSELDQEEAEKRKEITYFAVRFQEFRHVMDYAVSCAGLGSVVSRLYRDRKDENYVLFVLKHTLPDKSFRRLFETAREFGTILRLKGAARAHLMEQSDCLIEEYALNVLITLDRMSG